MNTPLYGDADIRILDFELTDEQLELTQEFAWAGTQDIGCVAGGAVRHPKGHLKSIKEALGL